MSGRPEVLLVGHDASRTGAPLVALHWLRWAVADGRADVRAVLQRGGPLLPSYQAACSTVVRSRAHGLAAPARRALGRSVPASGARGPVVVANTLAAWPAGAAIGHRSRLVLWVHELDHVAARIVTPDQRRELLAATDHLIAVGDRVAEMLVERWHVAPAMVTTVDSFLDGTPAPREPVPVPGAAPCDVLGVGSLTPRKGPDAFVAVLAAIAPTRPGVRAAWLGGPAEGPTAELVRHDIDAAGLGSQVALAGEVDDVAPWLHPGTVLLHPAREDPAPLAVLEAARAGLAVVTWDTGGAADLLRAAGLGHLVAPAGDLLGVARRLDALLADDTARTRAGAALREAVAGRTTEALAPVVLGAVLGTGSHAAEAAR